MPPFFFRHVISQSSLRCQYNCTSMYNIRIRKASVRDVRTAESHQKGTRCCSGGSWALTSGKVHLEASRNIIPHKFLLRSIIRVVSVRTPGRRAAAGRKWDISERGSISLLEEYYPPRGVLPSSGSITQFREYYPVQGVLPSSGSITQLPTSTSPGSYKNSFSM